MPNIVQNMPQAPRRKLLAVFLGVIILLLVAFLFRDVVSGWVSGLRYSSQDWYAVHLSNGKTYFGHVSSVKRDVLELSNVHILEIYEPEKPQSSTGEEYKVESVPQRYYTIVRRSDEKPFVTNDTVFIERKSVLFWEKMNSDSEVVQTIEKNK